MKDKISERFEFEWENYGIATDEIEKHLLSWIYPLTKEDFKDKVVLDAGCGSGRNSYLFAKWGAKKITAIDSSKSTIENARNNLKEFNNIELLHKSIYDLDYIKKFDIVICIGVLHHLENPDIAIRNLENAAKDDGKLVYWVYAKEGNEWVVKYINPIRKITSRLPSFIVDKITYFVSIPFYFYLRLPQKKKYFKIISQYKFKRVHLIILDQLVPIIANYWSIRDIGNIFKDYKSYYTNNNSYTLIR